MSSLLPLALLIATAAESPRLPALDISLQLGRSDYGTWEAIEFDWGVMTTRAARVSDGDFQARRRRGSLSGTIVKLSGSKTRTLPLGLDAEKNAPRFTSFETLKPRTWAVYDRGVDVEEVFGRLPPGEYSLQLVVPAGRIQVDGVPHPALASNVVSFRILAEDRGARVRALDAIESAVENVWLEAVPDPKSGRGAYRVTVINGSKEPVTYSAGDQVDPPNAASIYPEPCARFAAEALSLQGQWRGFAVDGCIMSKPFTLAAGQRATYRAWLPWYEKPRFLRFMLVIGDQDARPVRWTRSIGIDREAKTKTR